MGREAELEAVLTALGPEPGPGGRLRVVVGHYGTGKTHLLECVREQALARGYAVAVVTLDSREVTAAHPRRIYRMLMRSLTLPGCAEQGGLAPLFEELLAQGYLPRSPRARDAHRYLDPALTYFAALADEPALRDLLLDWIEGQPGEWSGVLNRLVKRVVPGPRLLALPDFRTFGSVYAYLLGGVAHLCQQAGGRGLCLFIDEAEFYAALGAQNRGFADTVFGCYALACLRDDQALQGEESIPKGGQAIHRRLPLRFRPDQPLACVFFLTPDPVGLEALGTWVDLRRHTVELTPLGPEHYSELYQRVVTLYGVAHPGFIMPAALALPMGDFLHAALACGLVSNPRSVLKLVVELLDLCRLAPHHLATVMQDLDRLFDGA